jgi:hypothetical protein
MLGSPETISYLQRIFSVIRHRLKRPSYHLDMLSFEEFENRIIRNLDRDMLSLARLEADS